MFFANDLHSSLRLRILKSVLLLFSALCCSGWPRTSLRLAQLMG